MKLKAVIKTTAILSSMLLLSGCIATDFRGENKDDKIDRLINENNHLNRKIRHLTADSGQLVVENDQLAADNQRLKQRLLTAVQALDEFRKKVIYEVNTLADNTAFLELIGNEVVSRPNTLSISSRKRPVLLVDTRHQLDPFFVVKGFAGFFNSPTQVQLWLLEYRAGMDDYQVTYRSDTFQTGAGYKKIDLDSWQAASGKGGVFGLYFPNGNAALAYHETGDNSYEARISKGKNLLTEGPAVELDSSRDLRGVKISWGVFGIRQ